MAGAWETEDESSGLVGSLPMPVDAPYRTPSRNVSRSSRKSRRSTTPNGKNNKSGSPPPTNGDKGSKRSSRDVSNDENISLLDPRRFTPTLHASLVSEILALRRDQEEKLKIIESLETSLQTVREESESLQANLLDKGKESRELKRQLELVEGGASSVVGELTQERDDAVKSISSTKKQLELAQKKLRSQEEDSERVHRQWAKEKDEWEEEKRRFEQRVHVAESRLRVVLDEVAAFQISGTNKPNGMNGPQNGTESDAEDSDKENDAGSVRTLSLTNSIRFSMASGGVVKPNGNSLADELGFEGFDDESEYGGRESVLSNGRRDSSFSHGHRDSVISMGANHLRNMSRDSILSRTHIRRQSNDSLVRSSSIRGKLVFSPTALDRFEDGGIKEDDETEPVAAPRANYVDTGVQFSPPPSPKIVPAKPATPEPSPFLQRYERLFDADSPPRADLEIEANQRRKRVQIGQPLAIKSTGIKNLTVNSSSQTVEPPLSPPKTPKTPLLDSPPTPKRETAEMISVSTQTDETPAPAQLPSIGLPPISIPSISIIPPSSQPGTPREPRLPQLSKDFGCQVSLIGSPRTLPPTTSTGMQTEEIRVDKRLAKLPPHLHPSAITSRPTSPAIASAETAADDSRQFTPVPGTVPPRNPRRLTSKRSMTELPSSPPIGPSRALDDETRDAYPGNNDNGPVSSQTATIRRPHRISSLFAGFDGNTSDEGDEFMDPDITDSEYRTALSAPKPIIGSVRGGTTASSDILSSPEQSFSPPRIHRHRHSPREVDESDDFGPVNIISQTRETWDSSFGRSDSRRGARPSWFGTKSSVMRKSAMIQNGIATHSRTRSPSLADTKQPPFPIPTRASSRKPPLSASAPSDGWTTPGRTGDAWVRRNSGRSHYRAGSIRKVRSTATMSRPPRSRRRSSRSPPPFGQTVEAAPESPGLPPLPNNDITTPRNKDTSAYSKYRSHRSQPSTNTATTGDTAVTAAASQAGSGQTVTVVEAIAQTMVGEWMFKYVRRRKSFGVADTRVGDDSSNDRHKRWVWLAPYERSILWSSKQPASGSALLGKSGRKLTIQSVLDVKDDNPPPKGSGPLFNRSILILTPQRALKFTATNADRHYIWITALSFLAHSNQAIPETLPVAQEKPLPEQYELPKTKVRRPIRDSIRLTKAKSGGAMIKSDPVMEEPDSIPPSIPTNRNPMQDAFSHLAHTREESLDPAQPPAIQRFPGSHPGGVHGRKRSNTGGHMAPPLSFRGFSGPAGSAYHAGTSSTAGTSITGSSDIYSNAGASGITGVSATTWGTTSVRTSEASTRPSNPNFFDAIGTVRMEAFISPLAFSRFDETPHEHENDKDSFRYSARRRSKEIRRRASRSRQRDSYHIRGTRGTEDLDEWFRDDPFRGF
ncbi:anucleate primary sterigmata protein A [Podospora fimiseda]|uniref:Anucleate primary sterigmata protein A n=1 Tax=Podospora fimiseda TaxID=252190 RepID=A0AAN7BSI0_9PEZI|nr:anucleate primary sterigmata protein A [Podospora fimiseda]